MAKQLQLRGEAKLIRDQEIYRLRVEEHWTYRRMAQYFSLSVERVRQIFIRMGYMKQQRSEFWRDLRDEAKWIAAARQMVRLFLMDGLTPREAIVEVIRRTHPSGAVLDVLRDMDTEA